MTDRILVVGPAWVGDMVMAQGLFALLRARRPACTVDVLAPPWTLPLLSRMPQVSAALALPMKHGQLHLKERWQMGRHLRKAHYQQAIVLPNSFKSALIPFWATIPVRTGFRGEMRYGVLNDLRRLDVSRYPRMIDRFLALGLPSGEDVPEPIPLPELIVSSEERDKTIQTIGLNPARGPILVLCPGAEFGPSKQWRAAHFAAVARTKQAEGWQVWLLGSAADRAIAEQIDLLTGKACVNLAGQTTLGQAIDLISLAAGVVTNDSGLMHVAAALRRPLVAVFGSTSPLFTPPLSPTATVMQESLPCQPCFKRICPLEHHRCMLMLQPGRVLAALSGWAP